MHAVRFQFVREHLVHPAVAIEEALADKALRYHLDPEVSFAACPRSRVPGVKVRFVDHLQGLRRQRCLELLPYPFRNGSRCSIHVRLLSLVMRDRHAPDRKYAPRLAGVHLSSIMTRRWT